MTLMLCNCEQDAAVQRLPDQLARHHGPADLGVQLLLDHLAQGGHGWRAADPRSCRRAHGRGQRTDGAGFRVGRAARRGGAFRSGRGLFGQHGDGRRGHDRRW